MMKQLALGMVGVLCACGGGTKSLLDPAFGTMGSTTTSFSCPESAVAEALVKTGNGFVVSGAACDGWALVGYTEKGELDPAFGDAGVALFFSGEGIFTSAKNLAVRSDGRLLAGGSSMSKSVLLQLSAAGKVDAAFSAESESDIAIYFKSSFVFALQPDGNLVVTDGQEMLRLKPDGTRDSTFGAFGGVSHLTLFGTKTFPQQVLIHETGKIVFVGTDNTTAIPGQPFVAQFTATGVLDSSFGTNGIVRLPAPPGGKSSVRAGVVQSDGMLILAGSDHDSTSPTLPISHPVLWRITAAGSMDSTFGTNGRAPGLVDKGIGVFTAVSVLASATIVTAGATQKADDFSDSWQVARFTSAGTLDPSFGVAGTTVFEVGVPGIAGGATALVAASDAYVVAGRAQKTESGPLLFGLARVLP